MTTERQIEANRRNAQHSTGPTTPEGKRTSSGNAVKIGIYASEAYTIHRGPFEEDPDEYEEFLRRYMKGLAPRDHIEIETARTAATSAWKLRRCDRFEAAALSGVTAEARTVVPFASSPPDPTTSSREQGALAAFEDTLQKVAAVYTATSRNLERTLRNYRTLQQRALDPGDLCKEGTYEPNPDDPSRIPDSQVIQPERADP